MLQISLRTTANKALVLDLYYWLPLPPTLRGRMVWLGERSRPVIGNEQKLEKQVGWASSLRRSSCLNVDEKDVNDEDDDERDRAAARSRTIPTELSSQGERVEPFRYQASRRRRRLPHCSGSLNLLRTSG